MRRSILLPTAMLACSLYAINIQAATTSTRETGTLPTSDSTTTPATSSSSSTILLAHGVVMSAAFAILYPLGAMAIRLLSFKGLLWFHVGLMAFSSILVLAGTGFGVNIALEKDLMTTPHAGLGLLVVVGLLLQPVTGLLHHRLYKKTGGLNRATPWHVWWGRALITLGIVVGGMGFQLANDTKVGVIVYGVVAGVMWVAWIASIVYAGRKLRSSEGGSVKLAPMHSRRDHERMQESQQA